VHLHHAQIGDRIYSLATILRAKLADVDGGVEKCSIVTFMAEQTDATTIKQALAAEEINVTTPRGSGSLVSFQQRVLQEPVRASLHYYNTEGEIDYFIDTLGKVLKKK